MKQRAKLFAIALMLANGLVLSNSAQAQSWTLSDFHNFNLSATYANWDADGSQIINGGTGFTPIITSGPTSYEVVAQGYGSGAYNFSSPINASGANIAELTFTINSTTTPSTDYIGVNFDISDGTHQVQYLGYDHYSGPGTHTLTVGLGSLDPSTITAFNLELDPAAWGWGSPYDITYNSLIVAVPEPATIGLAALGAAGFVLARRRRSRV